MSLKREVKKGRMNQLLLLIIRWQILTLLWKMNKIYFKRASKQIRYVC